MHSTNVWTAWALRVHDGLTQAADRMGLDIRACTALTLIGTHDGCSADWLRRRVGLTQSGTVRLVDRLSALGLVARGARTGRLSSLSLTAEGRARLAQWIRYRDQAIGDLVGSAEPAHLERLTAVLAAMLEGEQRTRPEADAACRACDWPACGTDCPVDRSVPAGDP
jgi:DNA-binding MarR family transcriptional regulator